MQPSSMQPRGSRRIAYLCDDNDGGGDDDDDDGGGSGSDDFYKTWT